MEIRFFRERFTDKDPEPLMNQIRRMASGEAPFLPTTLSLVYDGLVEDAFTNHASPDSGRCRSTPDQSVATSTPPQRQTLTPTPLRRPVSIPPPPRRPIPTLNVAPPPTPSTVVGWGWARLKCTRCHRVASVNNLRYGLHCPRCPEGGRYKRVEEGRPLMRCTECNALRDKRGNVCLCSIPFM